MRLTRSWCWPHMRTVNWDQSDQCLQCLLSDSLATVELIEEQREPYVLPCVILFCSCIVVFSPFSIAITSFGEERATLSAFRTFVRFALVWFCLFPLPLGVWEGLPFVTVTLPGLFSYLFSWNPTQKVSQSRKPSWGTKKGEMRNKECFNKRHIWHDRLTNIDCMCAQWISTCAFAVWEAKDQTYLHADIKKNLISPRRLICLRWRICSFAGITLPRLKYSSIPYVFRNCMKI